MAQRASTSKSSRKLHERVGRVSTGRRAEQWRPVETRPTFFFQRMQYWFRDCDKEELILLTKVFQGAKIKKTKP
jgi:hypothetical protein